jgi:hypothetical protein
VNGSSTTIGYGRIMRFEPVVDGANIIGGSSTNAVSGGVRGAIVAGGGGRSVDGHLQSNIVTDHFGTISGGINNRAGDNAGTTGDRPHATIAGGRNNVAAGAASTIGGGAGNSSSGEYAVIAGGNNNVASNNWTSVIGGFANTASGYASTVAGGGNNLAAAQHGFIGGGSNNEIVGTLGAITGGEQNDAGATSFVGGGKLNNAAGTTSAIAGGQGNFTDQYGFVGAGKQNVAQAFYTTIAGGEGNQTTAHTDHSSIGGGKNNTASGLLNHIGGGELNKSIGTHAIVVGGLKDSAMADYAFAGGGSDNKASGQYATVTGGVRNKASGYIATVGGGIDNSSSQNFATVGGGNDNKAAGLGATVSGGATNNATGIIAVIAGGSLNINAGDNSSIGGGSQNKIAGANSVIGGGTGNRTGYEGATNLNTQNQFIGGGIGNTTGGDAAVIAGGLFNQAVAGGSFIGAGSYNYSRALYSVIAGGDSNLEGDGTHWSAILGGHKNSIFQRNAVIVGGSNNIIGGEGINAYIGGGNRNIVNGPTSTILAGEDNQTGAHTDYSFIGAGKKNSTSGMYATISGGLNNAAGEHSAIPGGRDLQIHQNSFGFNADGSGTRTNLGTATQLAYFGNANLWLGNVDNTARELRFYEPNTSYTYSGTNYTAFKGQSQSANIVYTLPAAQGAANTVLVNDGSGSLSWATQPASVSGSGTADKIAVWNSSSSITGPSDLTYKNNRLGIGASNPAARLEIANDPVTGRSDIVLGNPGGYMFRDGQGAIAAGMTYGPGYEDVNLGNATGRVIMHAGASHRQITLTNDGRTVIGNTTQNVTPQGTLHILDASGNAATRVYLQESSVQGTNEVFGVYSNNGATARLSVKDGKVGIGNNTPSTTLDVTGNARITSTLKAAGLEVTAGSVVLSYSTVGDGGTMSGTAVVLISSTGNDADQPTASLPASAVNGQVLIVTTNDPDGALVDDGVSTTSFTQAGSLRYMYSAGSWKTM